MQRDAALVGAHYVVLWIVSVCLLGGVGVIVMLATTILGLRLPRRAVAVHYLLLWIVSVYLFGYAAVIVMIVVTAIALLVSTDTGRDVIGGINDIVRGAL